MRDTSCENTPARAQTLDLDNDVLTLRDAAVFLHYSLKTTRKLIEQGVIPATMIGSEWRLSRRQLLALVENGLSQKAA